MPGGIFLKLTFLRPCKNQQKMTPLPFHLAVDELSISHEKYQFSLDTFLDACVFFLH